MSDSMLALPVSVEQVAVTIRQMSPAERQRLFELAPELREAAYNMPRALDEVRPGRAIARRRAASPGQSTAAARYPISG